MLSVGKDSNGNLYLVFIHYFSVHFYNCPSHSQCHIQLLKAGLYSTTVQSPYTAVTIQGFKWLLSWKSLVQNYYKKLLFKKFKRWISSTFFNLALVFLFPINLIYNNNNSIRTNTRSFFDSHVNGIILNCKNGVIIIVSLINTYLTVAL